MPHEGTPEYHLLYRQIPIPQYEQQKNMARACYLQQNIFSEKYGNL